MKLPEELKPYITQDWWDTNSTSYEAIVRHCATIVFNPERDDRKASPVSEGASRAILSAFGLEEKP